MKRKPTEALAPVETVKNQAVLNQPMARCEVCGGDAHPNPTEQLCWVCRRLKISAWRDVEQQAPAQE
jgi:hypothetical protein